MSRKVTLHKLVQDDSSCLITIIIIDRYSRYLDANDFTTI